MTTAVPVAPQRGFSFTGWTNSNPDDPQPGADLDQEFDRSNGSIAEVIARLALVQRDDGALANKSVGTDQLTDELAAAIGVTTGAQFETTAAFNSWRTQLLNLLVAKGLLTPSDVSPLMP